MASEEPQGGPEDRRSCRTEFRCTRGARYVTGADIVRIARTLAMEPWHFTESAPAAADDPTGILLDQGRRRVSLRLANAVQGCAFLVRTPSGATHCGLGDLAPLSCRTFPAEPNTDDAVVCPRPGCDCQEDCGCLEKRDEEALAENRKTWAADRDHWYRVVAGWNAMPSHGATGHGLEDFHRFLLEAEYTREADAARPEEVPA